MADAPNWDDLEPITGGPSQQSSTPNWDDLEPVTAQPERPKPPEGEEPSTVGSAVRGVARSIIPTTAGVLGGIAGGAIGTGVAPGVGTVGGALVGAVAAGGATRNLQDTITDTLGLDSPESRERDVQAHPYVSTAAELAPAAATLQFGAVGKTLSERLASRVASGAALGGFDAINQGITKGFGNIDPTQTAIAAGAGAAMPGVRPWAEGAAGASLRAVGASRAAARLGAQEGAAAGADQGVVKVDGPAPDIEAALKPAGQNPAPGIDAREGPAAGEQAANNAFLQQGQRLNQDFPVRPTPEQTPRDMYVPGEEQAAANENQPWNINQTDRATREPGLGGAGSPSMMQRYGERTRLAIPDRLQRWRGNNPLDIEAERAKLAETDPRLAAANQAAVNVPAQEQAVTPANLAPGENLHIPEFLQRAKNPAPQIESEKIPAAGVAGQNENVFEPTEAGQQGVLPGAERISDAELAQRQANQPLRPTAEQKPMEEGIFGETAPQGEMFKSPNVRQPKVAPKPFEDMVENAEQYRQNAKDRAEQGLGTQRITTTGEELARQGRTVEEVNAEYAQNSKSLEESLPEGTTKKDIDPNIWDTAVRNISRGDEPVKALDDAHAQFEKEAVFTPTPEGEMHSLGAAATKGEILKAKSRIGDALKGIWDNINKGWRSLMTPEHLTGETGNLEDIIREKTSMSDRNRIMHTKAQEELEKAINQTTSPSQRNDFATGIWDGQIHPDNPLQRLADPAHKAIQDSLIRLKEVDPEGDWRKNFLPQMFADKDRARELIQDWEDQGRKGIPSPGDFMRNGVKLRDDVLRADGSVDPIQMMQRWHTGVDNFVRTKQTINEALKDGGPLFTEEFPDSVKLNSITKNGAPIYATPEVAMMADRYFTGPNSLDPTSRNFWDAAQKMKNFSTMWQLGLGAYHAVAETTEAYVGEAMRAIANPNRAGEILKGAPTAPYRQATKTFQDAMERYMDKNGMDNGTPVGKAVHYLVKTGLAPERIARYTPDVDSAARNAIEAFQKGALQMEINEKGARIGKAFEKGALKGVGQAAGEGVRALGEAMQTTMHPLFNVYIPRLKVGAAVEQMLDYAMANPNAEPAELMRVAKAINKSVDDRLGELNQNYLFWNNFLKRFANLAMISPGWETGTLRAFFGGTKSLIESRGKALFTKNPEYTPNAAYPIAFAAVTALVGMTYQFLKTGKPPEDVRDPFFPKTGGTVARTNQPERAILPGYQKDVYSWWHLLSGHEGMTKNAASMLYNKLSLVPRSVWDTMADKDWSGHQIYNPDDPTQKKFADYMGYVHRNMMPIAYQTQRVRDPESNITRGEAELGIRHAPASIQKPTEEAAGIAKQNAKEQEKTRRFYNRLEGGPQPEKPKKSLTPAQ